jgi:hypothetical protein
MIQLTAMQKLLESIEYWSINIDCPNLFKAICEQALELEKQQIIDAHKEGNKFNGWALKHESETYYNRTFKNDKQ